MFSDKAIAEIDALVAKYPVKRSACMDALKIAQRERGGHLTGEDMREVASILDMMPVEVESVATFYTMYNVERPIGRFHIQVCRNLSCDLLGAEMVIDYICRKLGIELGGTSEDNCFTLTTAECLGSCGTAPMMQINDKYYEDLTEEKIDEILETLRNS